MPVDPAIGEIINALDAELDAADSDVLEEALDELDDMIGTYRAVLLSEVLR